MKLFAIVILGMKYNEMQNYNSYETSERAEVKSLMAGSIVVDEIGATGSYQDMRGRISLSAKGFIFSSEDPKTDSSFTNEKYDQIMNRIAYLRHKLTPPVYVEGGSIKVSSKRLEIGKQYPILFNEKKYVVIAPKEGVIDLYELTD